MTPRKQKEESSRVEYLREPPQSHDAECAVLGGLMLNENALTKVQDWLSEQDFFRSDHRIMFRAICELSAQGKPHDSVTMGEWFEANAPGTIDPSYAIRLANSTPSAANISAYAEIVREKARLRELITVGTEITSQAFAPRADASSIASGATNALGALVGDPRGGGLVPARGAVTRFWAKLQHRFQTKETITGVETPFGGLNELTMGLQPGELYVMAARPSMGKTLLALQIAVHNAIANPDTGTSIFSLEMSAESLIQRAVSNIAGVPHTHLRNPSLLTEEEWARTSEATLLLNKSGLQIDDQSTLSATQIVARAKRQHMRKPLSLLVVDHLGEMKTPGKENRANELGTASRTLRALLRDLGIPGILLVQLNRSNLARQDQRPTLGDLRGSGEIEEVLDVALLIHREEYYNRATHLKGVIELIPAKGRDLPIHGSIYLQNFYSQMRAEDWVGDLPQPPSEPPKRSRGLKASANGHQAPMPYADT